MGNKVNLNSVAELRTAADDALPELFQQLGYEQKFTLIDIKLALGLSTVAIAGGLYYLEKKVPFKDSYYMIMASIAVYAVISGAMFYLSNGPKYKNIKYVGVKDNKQKVAVYTSAKTYDPIYEVKMVFNDNFAGAISESVPFAKMFDAFGFLDHPETKSIFEKILEKKGQ
ncbi:hypothetical protein OY671_003009 [Metschnikowia pulcherrima]|nr:hypothetical protein OY671_003009 [Metschnikowia pulcherrima]